MDAKTKKVALRRMTEGSHPHFDWPLTASHVTRVAYVGITGRRGAVQARVVHPPRTGEQIRWLRFSKGDARCRAAGAPVRLPCRYTGRESAHFETATCAMKVGPKRALSKTFVGAGAARIVSPHRQRRFLLHSNRRSTIAGTSSYSSVILPSPSLVKSKPPHFGQTLCSSGTLCPMRRVTSWRFRRRSHAASAAPRCLCPSFHRQVRASRPPCA